jgi:hypothetical protein
MTQPLTNQQPNRHTCRDRTTTAGPDWGCPQCATLRDLTAPRTEADQLRQQIDAVAALCDKAEQQARRWEHPLPVPEWVTAVRRAIDPAASVAVVSSATENGDAS